LDYRGNKKMIDVMLVSTVRAEIAAYGKKLKYVPVVELGGIVIKEAVRRANINRERSIKK
jgi:acetyl-CoA C-acetyltransferase